MESNNIEFHNMDDGILALSSPSKKAIKIPKSCLSHIFHVRRYLRHQVMYKPVSNPQEMTEEAPKHKLSSH